MSVRADCVCGRRLEVDRKFAGKQVECPDCFRQVYVPGLADSAPQQPAVAASSATPKPRRQQTEPASRKPSPRKSAMPVVEPVAEADSEVIDLEPVKPAVKRKPQPKRKGDETRRRSNGGTSASRPSPGGMICPFCGASVRRRDNAELQHCPECDSEFSDLPPLRRRKKRRKPEEPKSKFRSVKQVVSENKESFPLWGKWVGVGLAAIFGFVVILQIFAQTAKNVEKEALEEATVEGIQNKYREIRMSKPTTPTVQINDLELGERHDNGDIEFTASHSTVIVQAGQGSPIYGLVNPRTKQWAYSRQPIETMDSPDVEMTGTISEATNTAYGAITFLVLLVFLATLVALARRFVF